MKTEPEIFDKDKLIKYSPVIVLVLAIAPWPSFYYWLLRIFICPISAYFAYKSYEDNNDTNLIIFSAMAILYNPIFPVFLYSKGFWVILNILSAIFIYKHLKKR